MKLEKITFSPDGDEPVDFYVLEQTKIAGVNYILVTDFEDGDGEALILKDLSKAEDTESVYEIVSDENELNAVAGVFEDLLEDVQFVQDDEQSFKIRQYFVFRKASLRGLVVLRASERENDVSNVAE